VRFDPQSTFIPADNHSAAVASHRSGVKTFFLIVGGLVLTAILGAGRMWAATGPEWFETLRAQVLGDRPAESSTSPVFATSDFVPPSVNEVLTQRASSPKVDRDARTAFETGRVHLASGRHAEAVPHLVEAIRLEPDFADAHYKLGLAYVRARDLEAARAEQHALEQLDPNLANLLNNLIR